MTGKEDMIARRVRKQYEQFPYPTPGEDLAPFFDGQVAELGFPRDFSHLMWPCHPPRADLDMLIAGCGTTQAVRYAAAHPQADITAVDISEASLEECRKLLARHRVKNVRLVQSALEDLPALGARYDFVACTGVIHHLAEPGAGLAALREALKPEGSMYLMVYAPFGRDAIYLLQNLFGRLGLRADDPLAPDAVGEIRCLLERLPPAHPLHFRKRCFPDLAQTAELVDYLLHPCDRAYTIDELYRELEGAGLTVQHLINRAHYEAELGDECPLLSSKLEALDEPDRLAAGELCRGGIFKHELFCCRADRAPETFAMDFQSRPPGRVIPWTSPSLVLEYAGGAGEEKVVVAASASHHFDDLKFRLDRVDTWLLNAIDGRRTLAEIAGRLQARDPSLTAGVLADRCRRLYRRDLVFPRIS